MIDREIFTWRAYLRSHGELTDGNLDELEDHLRDEIEMLVDKGLQEDEAFIIAIRRIGKTSEVAHEFSKFHGRGLWKQFLIDPAHASDKKRSRREILLVVVLALVSGVLSRVPEFFGISLTGDGGLFYVRNISFFIIPGIASYFLWRYPERRKQGVAFFFVLFVAVVVVNIYPVFSTGNFDILIGIHAPIVVWLAVSLVYSGADWRDPDREMDFVRFTGETFIYLVLIYMGGGVLLLTAGLLFSAIGIELEKFLMEYVAVVGACAAPVVAAYLARAKRNIIENMAPVLARIFSPLFLTLLVAFLIVLAISGSIVDLEREVLIGFDVLLAVVMGIVLYIVSARDINQEPGPLDIVNLALVMAALIVDAIVLVAILSRIDTYGFSPNKIAALGENILLFISLGGSAILYLKFLVRKEGFRALAVWHTSYLAVIGLWAAFVAFLFPLVFRS